MILKLKTNSKSDQAQKLIKWIREQKLGVNISDGQNTTIIGLVGDTTKVDVNFLKTLDVVEDVIRIQEPYKKANRKFHPDDTVINLENGSKIGGGHFAIMAGPCSVESPEQVLEIARSVKESGADILRGGAFKPRTSPYSFQGLGAKGIDYLVQAKKETGLALVSEIMSLDDLKYFEDVDILQVGARNMQNFSLLKELGKQDKPVLLKRGLSATYEELLMATEYIMAGGNSKVILCERGIRTFERGTRNTLDISAIPYLHEKSHLPIVVDPSHSAGISRMVRPLSLAATAAGADGLIIEVHNAPEKALCDGAQSIRPDDFDRLAGDIFKLRNTIKEI